MYFLAPDNGLLAPLVSRAPEALIVRLAAPALARLGIHRTARPFTAATSLRPSPRSSPPDACQPAELGETARTLVPSWVEEPAVEARSVSGVVITRITSAISSPTSTGTLAERFRLPLVHAGNHAFPMLRTYGETHPGEYLALVNSFGVIEIARAEGSAPPEGLGLSRGAPVVVRDRTDQP